MKGEYLLFNLLVLAGPLLLSFWRRTPFVHRFGAVALACLLASTPYVVWDALVTDRHWWFNPAYTLDWRPLGLPPGEWLFFVTVPFACAFSWEFLIKPERGRIEPGRAWIYAPLPLLVPAGLWVYSLGKEYTGLTLMALGFAASVDWLSGVRLLTRTRYPAFAALLFAQVFVFNGYLTARPVVLYDAAYQLDLRVITIPIEDFGYGLSLMHLSLVFFELGKRYPMLSRLIERRFGGYRHRLNRVDLTWPRTLDDRGAARPDTARGDRGQPRVAVIGGGIAGLTAASHLAERGLAVTIYEANDYVGGKLGSWIEEIDGMGPMRVEHGFHAFFRHYYNLNRFLDRLGIRERFSPIEDYTILAENGERFGFAGLHRTPALNLVSLLGSGMMQPRDLLRPEMRNMRIMLEYDEQATFEAHDDTSFAAFAAETRLPRNLQLVFNSFSRAFFADPEDMSLAELIKSFHFYFLSHDYGLIYDIPEDDHEHTVLAPIRAHLDAHGAKLRLRTPVSTIAPLGESGADGFEVDGTRFDYVVVAADVGAARDLIERSEALASELPTTWPALSAQKVSARYAVLRLWTDRDTDRDLPGFVMTDRARALDSVSLYHRFEHSSELWARERGGGGVYELHCYAVPEELVEEEDIRAALLEDFFAHFPELQGCDVFGEHFYVKRDFTAFHMGLHDTRPGVTTDLPGLYLAGDWVRLPCPAMLMEAAATSGIMAANEVLVREGLQPEALFTVPLHGLLRPTPASAAP